MTGKKTLVTGYAGFIGKHLCKRLLCEGHRVLGADLKDAGIGGVKHFGLDITDPKSFDNLPRGIDNLIHLAGISFIPKASGDIISNYDVNMAGTFNALRYFASAGGSHFIFASSSKVYAKPEGKPLSETHPTNPSTAYGRAKLLSERLIEAFSLDWPKRYSILRQFNAYGPGQNDNFFIPSVANQLSRSDDLRVGSLDVKRDFLYIDDLIDAYVTIIKNQKKPVETYNIGSGKSTGLRKVISEMAGIMGRNPRIIKDGARVRDEAGDICASISRIKRLGWKPETELAKGLGIMLENG